MLLHVLFSALLLTSSPAKKPMARERDDSASMLFPPGALETFDANWFGNHLRAMHEDRLDTLPGENLRFLWLRTFNHPVAIRIWSQAGHVRLRVVELDGQGGYEPGHPMLDRTIELAPAVWTRLRFELDALGFWTMPSADPNVGTMRDGAEWVLEGSRDGRYHAVTRQSPMGFTGPNGHSPYADLCLEMLRLSGLKPKAVY